MAIITATNNGQWVGLYQEGDIRLICKTAVEKSEIFNREMDIITDLVVSINNLNVYQASSVHMPYNYEGLISIVNFVEKVVTYIKYTDDGMHARKRFLDKFFIDKNVTHLDIYYRNKIRELKQEDEDMKQQAINKEIAGLKEDIRKEYNKLGYAVTYNYSSIFIIDKKHSSDDVISRQDSFLEIFEEKNIRDDKTKTREQFLYKHIARDFNNDEYIKTLKKELEIIAL